MLSLFQREHCFGNKARPVLACTEYNPFFSLALLLALHLARYKPIKFGFMGSVSLG